MYGTATLTNTNVYLNRADYVRSPFQLSLNFHPLPHCMLTVGGVLWQGYVSFAALRQIEPRTHARNVPSPHWLLTVGVVCRGRSA